MKLAKHFIGLFILISVLSVFGFPQTVDSKIASIDTEAFQDKENGIKEFAGAYKKLEIEFKPQKDELNSITEKIEKITEEFKECEILGNKSPDEGCRPASISDRYKRFGKLAAEFREKTEQRNRLYSKREAEILAEIKSKVFDAVMKFAEENGFVIILDSSKENNYLHMENAVDVTRKFIEFYNKKYDEIK